MENGKGVDGFKRVLWVYSEGDLKHTTDFNTVELEKFRELIHEIEFGKKNIVTYNLTALRQSQEFFDIVYVDDKMIWPENEWTSKEIRLGHNLLNYICAIIGEQVTIDEIGYDEYKRECKEFEKALNSAVNDFLGGND